MSQQYDVGSQKASGESEESKKQQQEALEEQRRLMLKQILTPEASERLANIKLVKPEKARMLEDSLIRSAQYGRIGKVDEEQLKQFLSQFNEMTDKKTKVTISRRKAFDDDEDDF